MRRHSVQHASVWKCRALQSVDASKTSFIGKGRMAVSICGGQFRTFKITIRLVSELVPTVH